MLRNCLYQKWWEICKVANRGDHGDRFKIKERSFVSKNFQNVSELENYFTRNLKELQNRWRECWSPMY